MRYRSTRSEEKISAPQALLQGLAKDGGLYVPETVSYTHLTLPTT